MLIIQSPSKDAYFNIAAEEYFLKSFNEDIFFAYINQPSIIIGKHQNALAEINSAFVDKHQIKVVRRLSGGGTVYHDTGNINYSFHTALNPSDETIDFERFSQPLILFLESLGINAKRKGQSDLVIDDKKFSGNAKIIYNNKVLQHGTILFNSDLNFLSDALKVNPLKFNDKSVKSRRSVVTNIADCLTKPLKTHQFLEKFINFVPSLYGNAKPYQLTTKDMNTINELVQSKYATWEWNFGNSPEYTFNKGIQTSEGNIEFNLYVKSGIIKKAKISGNFYSLNNIENVEKCLVKKKHNFNSLNQALLSLPINEYFENVSVSELLEGLL